MAGGVVEHEVNVEVGGNALVDRLEELQELGRAVASMRRADHLAALEVQRGVRGQLLLVHKVSFIVWVTFTSVHVLGHLPHMPGSLRAVRRDNPGLPAQQLGSAGRWISIAGAVVGGLVLAIVLIPAFATWTAHTALLHHHH